MTISPDEIELDFGELPTPEEIAETYPDEDTGICTSCGGVTHRPDGLTPTGRRPRIPKLCPDCKGTRTSTAPRTSSPRRSSRVDIAQSVTDVYTALGFLIARQDAEIGVAIIGEERLQRMMTQGVPQTSIAEDAGRAAAHIADHHPKVKTFLTNAFQTADWSEFVFAHMPLVPIVAKRQPKLNRARLLLRIRKAFRRDHAE